MPWEKELVTEFSARSYKKHIPEQTSLKQFQSGNLDQCW